MLGIIQSALIVVYLRRKTLPRRRTNFGRRNLLSALQYDQKRRNLAEAQSVGAGLRILMVSIVDPAGSLNGAGTVTRGLLRVFEAPDLRATVESLAIPPPSYHYHSLRQMGSIARSFVYAMPAKRLILFPATSVTAC